MNWYTPTFNVDLLVLVHHHLHGILSLLGIEIRHNATAEKVAGHIGRTVGDSGYDDATNDFDDAALLLAVNLIHIFVATKMYMSTFYTWIMWL